MDKKFVMGIAAMAALTLVSCSSDDLDSFSDNSSKNEAISFDGYLGRSAVAVNGSRGSVETVETLKKNGFGVFSKYTGTGSFSDFANQQVTYKYSKWTYTPIKYWPTTAGQIDFYAYAPYVQGKQLTNNTCMEFDVAHDVADQKDLLWSRVKAQINTPITNTNNKVKFQFAHALSRLGYTIKLHETNSSATFTLNKITLAGSPDEKTNAFYKKGTIDLSKVKDVQTGDAPIGLWNAATSDDNKQNLNWVSGGSIKVENTDPEHPQSNDPNNYLFVIPQDFSKEKDPQKPTEVVDELYVIVQYTITYPDGGEPQTNTVYKQIKKKFEQGKAYMLNLTIGLPIEFDVDLTDGVGVDGWGKEDGIDIGSGSNDNLWDGIK